jgi:aquaporin TIP
MELQDAQELYRGLDEKPNQQQPVHRKKKVRLVKLPFTTEKLKRIFYFEILGTGLLAYGALACEGNYLKLAAFFFLAIILAGPFSGAHINPAITLAFYLREEGGITGTEAKVYFFGQIVGGFAGSFFGYMILGHVDSPFVPRQQITWMLADFLGEIIGTFFFITFIQIQVNPKTAIAKEPLCGFVLITLALIGGRQLTSHSGGCLNPGLALSMNLWVGFFHVKWERFYTIWIVTVGPFLGGYLSTKFYENVYMPLHDIMTKENTEDSDQLPV